MAQSTANDVPALSNGSQLLRCKSIDKLIDDLEVRPRLQPQAEALDDTFEMDMFSPIRQDWLDHTDDYFHHK